MGNAVQVQLLLENGMYCEECHVLEMWGEQNKEKYKKNE